MISIRSVRFNLTLWYLAVLASGMILFGTGTWLMLRHTLITNGGRELERQLSALELFLSQESRGDDLPAVREEAREYSTGLPDGQGLGLWDAHGKLLLEIKAASGRALRLRKQLVIRGNPIVVELSLPSEDVYQTLSTLEWIMLALLPLVLGIAVAGGWWLAQRALKPVGSMTHEARSINANDFTARLSVPATRDELQELAEAWNELLGRIEEAVRSVTRFTADAAHELRTPVTVIRTAAELALRHPRSPESHRQTLEAIQRETEQMTGLIEQLLLLARGDAGQWQFHFDSVFADAVLRRLQKVISSLAESKHIQMDWTLPDQPMIVWADELALRRLVMILADNALKFTPSGGRVAVRLQALESECAIEVSDTGCGIRDEELPHVFERFYRADPARTPGTGIGLGLAIARTIVEAHHGRIEALSAGETGTIFRVVLPATLPSPTPVEQL
jgi:two-component system heavy metal sensor histidine kinase CusS